MLDPKFIDFLKTDRPGDWQKIVDGNNDLTKDEFVALADEIFVDEPEKDSDPVNHPSHYLKCAVTVEPIELTSRLDACLGQAINYVLRAPYKGSQKEDLKKALFYLNRELSNIALCSRYNTTGTAFLYHSGSDNDSMRKAMIVVFVTMTDENTTGGKFLRKLFNENFCVTKDSLEFAIEFLEEEILALDIGVSNA